MGSTRLGSILMIGISALLMLIALSGGQTVNLHVGVNNLHLGWASPEQRDKVAKDMWEAGVRTVRESLASPFDHSIDSLDVLGRKGLSILLVVEIAWPNLVGRGVTPRPGRGPIYSVPALSAMDPAFFRQQFSVIWDEIERRGVRLVAIEVGNEINWAAFNGDLALLPAHGKAWKGAPGSEALIDRASYLLGPKRYIEALGVVRYL
jgi:hypothetical protein